MRRKKPSTASRPDDLFTPPKQSDLRSRVKISSSIPAEALETVDAMRARLKMSMTEFINSAVAYACWCEKEHHLTGEAVREGGDAERAMWAEIVRDFGKPNKTGSFFDHAVARRLSDAAKSLDEP